eukprot:s1680_g13.t1
MAAKHDKLVGAKFQAVKSLLDLPEACKEQILATVSLYGWEGYLKEPIVARLQEGDDSLEMDLLSAAEAKNDKWGPRILDILNTINPDKKAGASVTEGELSEVQSQLSASALKLLLEELQYDEKCLQVHLTKLQNFTVFPMCWPDAFDGATALAMLGDLESSLERFFHRRPLLKLKSKADGEIVTIEIPDSLVKQWEGKQEFKTYFDEFIARNPPSKTFKGGKKSAKDGAQKNPRAISKRKQPTPELSQCITGVEQLPTDDEILGEVPIVNARANGKLSSFPMLMLSKKVGQAIKNETGLEASLTVTLQQGTVLCGFGKAKFREADKKEQNPDNEIIFEVTGCQKSPKQDSRVAMKLAQLISPVLDWIREFPDVVVRVLGWFRGSGVVILEVWVLRQAILPRMPATSPDGRTKLTKLKGKGNPGKLSSSASGTGVQSDIDWRVFGLDLESGSTGAARSPVPPPPRLGSGPSGAPKRTAGVKLESLDTATPGPAAFDSVDLSHLRSAVKRSPGYQEQLPSLLTLLEDRGVDYGRPNLDRDVQLPLEAFEDTTMWTRTPAEWQLLMRDANGQSTPLACTALRTMEDGSGRWQTASVLGWDAASQRYNVKWANGQEDKVLSLHVFFEGDDPILFADRLKTALQNRRYANSFLKYHFFVDSMPEDRSRKIGRESVARISKLAKGMLWDANSEFADKLNGKLETLLQDAQKEYVRVQNLITFEKVRSQGNLTVLPSDLVLPPPPESSPVPFLAVKVLPSWDTNTMGAPDPQVPRGFRQAFEWFCKASLVIRPEVCAALQVTRGMCLDLLTEKVFETAFNTPLRLQEFSERQEASIMRLKGRLGMWVNTIRMRITQCLQQATVKWYHLNETSIENYRASRLRPMLVCSGLMMSNAFLLLAEENLTSFVQVLESLTPLRVEMTKDRHVLRTLRNIVKPDPNKDEIAVEPTFKKALFKVEVVINPQIAAKAAAAAEAAAVPEDKKKDEKKGKEKGKEEEKKPEEPPMLHFAYKTDLGEVKQAVLSMFDKGMASFRDVHSIESVLLPHLIRDHHLDPIFSPTDAWVEDLRVRLEETLAKQEPWLQDILDAMESFKDVVVMDPEAAAARLQQEPQAPAQVKAMIEERKERIRQIQESIPDDKESIVIGFYRIETGTIRTQLIEKLEMSTQLLLKSLAETLEVNIHEATVAFEGIFTKLQTQVATIEECSDMKDFLKSIPNELAKLAGAVNEAMQLTDLVEDLRFELPAETLEARWEMFGSSGLVKSRAAKCMEYLNTQHDGFLTSQESEQKEFDNRLARLEEVIEGFSQYKDLGQVRDVAEKVRVTSEEIKQCQDLVRLYNSREVLFDRDQTDYSNLQTMIKTFEPYNNLWKTAGDWVSNKEAWLQGPFNEIDPRYCENEVTNGIRLLFKTIRTLKENEETKSICGIAEQIKTELEEFKPNLPLVTGLRNEGMRQRHWEQISEKSGVQVGPGMEGGFTLQRMLDSGLLNFANEVAEVGDRAGKEYGLEKTLNKMKADWEPLSFDLSEKYRKTGTYVLKGDGEAMVLLDEHIVTTQAMMFSTFKGPFEEDINEWNTRLMRVSETLEEWLKCQKSWMYLQPIFDSDDIMRQLPTEGKRFKHVDATWRQEMINTRENPKIIDICATEGLLEKWRECNITLDMVQKGLEDYLETKRNGFARFYFLSNDELLEILSQTKDPTRVQPFLSKVFEAMSKVIFTSDNEVTHMISPESEQVEMVAPVVTHQKAVEVWMGDLQDGMCMAIRNALEVGISSYNTMDRTDWVLANPAQIVLNGSQVFWTSEVEEAFDGNVLDQYAKKLSQQILDLIMLLRKGVSKLQTKTMNALIVIDVHAKDVIWGFVEQQVRDKTSFEWISQLRYYWEVDDRQQENMWVKCVQTSFPYGYEYLGNSMRLVITPLTDMCYITLMGAQSLSLGGAPAGPAGTGKTETTKDLAKALAKQCVVFNCSPEMDYIMVGKFFKGLAFSGAWCCFDEFNRINIEVLSVIAQQLMVLFGRKAELGSYNETVELEFEGTLIVMKPTFNVFITMNPGYAGRAELPDNLAALFRPVAMMVPDYALIGEIMFYAYGFTEAKVLAKKMVTTFTLSSEQLSSQFHYDYGMRAVKSTIEMCGKLKREVGDLPEDQITLRALRDVNVPKFLKDDLPLFENIISDLFPETDRPVVEYGNLTPEQNLQLTENFTIKVVQLIDTIGVRHGLMLVGPTGGGKTCNYRLLQATSIAMCEAGDKKYQKVQTHILNPKAITQAQLYGAFDEVTREWSDGVASECVRTAVASGKSGVPDNHWVIFDGPVDALWIEPGVAEGCDHFVQWILKLDEFHGFAKAFS